MPSSRCREKMLRFLHVAVLWFYFPPLLLCNNLLCFYSPILEKDRTFKLIVTECPTNELCFLAKGRFGNHSALSARGCMAEKDCSQVHNLRFKGTVYIMSYGCCDWLYCNACPGITANSLSITLTLTTLAWMADSL
ncbi:protein Bouncer [Channa argus]|uniref:protein Bouncer n=1 Tax=Channa argus TaxID=215402 RepID=UPI0035205F2B